MKRVAYTEEAIKALSRMPANVSMSVRAKIQQYSADPKSLANNVKRLRGRPGFRLRVGDWRVIFAETKDTVTVLTIGPRGGVYE